MRTAKGLARLRRCEGSPEPSLVTYVITTIISWAGSVVYKPVKQCYNNIEECRCYCYIIVATLKKIETLNSCSSVMCCWLGKILRDSKPDSYSFSVYSPTGSSFMHHDTTSNEPRHEKMCLWESPTRPDTNWPAQPQKLARVLKFRLSNLEILYCLSSEQQRRWSDCTDVQADLRLCCSHMT